MNRFGLPDLGLGVGLRVPHFSRVLEGPTRVDWFEVISENFMATEGRPMRVLEQVRRDYPVVLHGVSMSIGSTDPLDMDYLAALRRLADRIDVAWMGDHVCWTGVAGRNGHDLYPVPYTEESLAHVVERIKVVQGVLGRPLVLENPSTYLGFASDCMSEVEWIARMADESDCALLLDVNNVYVTCRNHGLDPMQYLRDVPWDRVVQNHLAGHTDHGTHCIDTHDDHVCDAVWELYGWVQKHTGGIATLLEWDGNIPDFDVLEDEVARCREWR
ncbi:MAG: DUF692 domain-containing protein [Deltaproteobacteria bacterium]|nr:DUF692 domain-containing protein [Deltaproteobacteria bacterium]